MSYHKELNKRIKVFSQLFVGLKKQHDNKIDLGFATPYEENAAGKKRQETVISWTGGTSVPVIGDDGNYKCNERGGLIYEKAEPNVKIVENKPRGGFKVTDDIKRIYWGGGNVVWRIEDPLGFELEIQSQNLMAIMQTAGINEGGLIPGYCVWGRDGANNILLHEKSEEYRNAITAAELVKKPAIVSTTNRLVGAKYLMQDGSIGTYLGKIWIATELEHREIQKPVMRIGEYYQSSTMFKTTIEDAVQYDAVRFDSFADYLQIKLYKKAPLIKVFEELSPPSPEEMNLLIKNFKNLSFAATSNYKKIVYASINKPEGLIYAVAGWDDTLFKARIENMLKHKRLFVSNARNAVAPRTASELNFFANDLRVGVTNNGKVYSTKFSVYPRIDGAIKTSHWLGQADLSGKTITTYLGDQYRPYNQERVVYPGRTGSVDAFEVPEYTDLESIIAWCQQLYDANKLVTISVIEA